MSSISGKKQTYNNGVLFYTKLKEQTIFKIILESKESCWMFSDEDYEDIKTGKKPEEIIIDQFPQWIFNNIHYGSLVREKLFSHTFNPVLHINGVEWNAHGTLCVSDHGLECLMDVYDGAMKSYIMGRDRYMPIITLD